MIKVSILDDQLIVLNGVQQMLHNNKEIKLTGVCKTKEELLSTLRNEVPDLLLLDIRMPQIEGDEIAAFISETYPQIKILVLTNFDTIHYIRKMVQNGVQGYLLKNTDQETLVTAIKAIYNGEQYFEESIKNKLTDHPLKHGKQIPSLTTREIEILTLITKQYSSQQIADKLFLSLRTIENHRYNLFQKLDVKNAAGLVTKAFELNLLEPDS